MKPHGQSQPLMYFDFDGTLHPKGCLWGASGPSLDPAGGHKLFEHARLLEAILGEYPTVRLVLDSMWTEKLGVNGALAHLSTSLRRRVVGTTLEVATPRLPSLQLSPSERILLDVERREPAGWVALDPGGGDWPQWAMTHIVQAHPVEGIGPVVVQAALHSKLLGISTRSPKG